MGSSRAGRLKTWDAGLILGSFLADGYGGVPVQDAQPNWLDIAVADAPAT